jgi:hypothetical protein
MRDPILRRVACAATVYWEMDPAGPRVARLVVDCPLPLLEDDDPHDAVVVADASLALARWNKDHPVSHPAATGAAPLGWESSTSYGAWEVQA